MACPLLSLPPVRGETISSQEGAFQVTFFVTFSPKNRLKRPRASRGWGIQVAHKEGGDKPTIRRGGRPWRRKGRRTTTLIVWIREAGQHVPQWRSALFVFVLVVALGLGAMDSTARRGLFRLETKPKELSQSDFPQGSNTAPLKAKKAPIIEKVPALEPWHYFHPRWQSQSLQIASSEGPSVPYQELFVTDEKLQNLVHDPDNRLEKEFQVPFRLRDRVLFWMTVYTRLSRHSRLVHDRDNPSLVYGTIDYTPLYSQISDKMRAELNRRNIEKRILSDLKARIEEAAGLTKTEMLTPWEKAELRAFLSRAGALNAERVAKLISRIRTQSGQRHEFLEALNRSERLLPYIEAVMKSYGLPAAIARLPFVESSFNARASSKVGAVGIWQFMPETARQMIHPTDRKIWAEPLTQSKAAARLIIIFRSLLPDWSTTLTAYNSGVGRLQRMVRTYHARDIVKIIESNDKTLGFAGKNFYAQFLTANLIEAYKEELFVELSDDEAAVQVAFRPVKTFNQRFREVY